MPADFKQGTNLLGKILASSQVSAANTNTTIYTVPASTAAKLSTFALVNVTNIAVTLSVSIVPSGGALDGTHKMVASFVLNAYDSIDQSDVLSFVQGAFLDAGAYVSVNVDTAAAVNYLLTGAVSS